MVGEEIDLRTRTLAHHPLPLFESAEANFDSRMSIFGDDYLRIFRLNFIFDTLGLAFLNVRSFAAIMKKFVYGGKEEKRKE